jgi:DNA helicase-2/ATP-dependent DNA helicase PcrA
MLSEDVAEPRGLACLTYNNECARELENRLDALGIAPSNRVFIGTVHSFSLTQILLPYAKTAGLALPDPFAVASVKQQRGALERAFVKTVGEQRTPRTGAFEWTAIVAPSSIETGPSGGHKMRRSPGSSRPMKPNCANSD